MNHLMIDLETLGTRPTSVFLSIAAIQFDIHTGKTGARFSSTVSMKSAMSAGLTIDPETLKWWMKQDAKVRAKMFESPNKLVDVLAEFSEFIFSISTALTTELKLWGNSAAFDLGILGNSFDMLGIARPWTYGQERCYRTINSEFRDLGDGVINTCPHDPVADCEYQIKRLVKVWQIINMEPYEKEVTQQAMELLHEIQKNSSPAVAQFNERVRKFLCAPPKSIFYKFEKRENERLYGADIVNDGNGDRN